MTRHVARTPIEAQVFLGMQPCEECDRPGTDWEYAAQVTVDGVVTDRYVGRCDSCGADRSAEFAHPDAADGATDDGAVTRFGGARPSQLLDVAEWLGVADAVESLASERGTSVTDRLTCVEYARDAYLEALKLLPPGAESTPESALFTEESRRAARAEPLVFTRDWLEAQAEEVGDWADRLRAEAGSGVDDELDHDEPDEDAPEEGGPDDVDETAELARVRTGLREELLAIARAVYPDGDPLVTRDDGPVAVDRAAGRAVEYNVADVGVSIAAPGLGHDTAALDGTAAHWDAADGTARVAIVLAQRGWRVERHGEELGHWAVAATRDGHTLYATMRADEGILRMTAETARYRLPARSLDWLL
jgi:hypothetical protein